MTENIDLSLEIFLQKCQELIDAFYLEHSDLLTDAYSVGVKTCGRILASKYSLPTKPKLAYRKRRKWISILDTDDEGEERHPWLKINGQNGYIHHLVGYDTPTSESCGSIYDDNPCADIKVTTMAYCGLDQLSLGFGSKHKSRRSMMEIELPPRHPETISS